MEEIGSKTNALNVACVPEHFSQPLFELESNLTKFSDEGIELKVKSSPGGTGQMIELLSTNACDIAVALTEGVVLRAVNDVVNCVPDPIQILGSYVNSSLRWSVAIAPNSNFHSVTQLKNARIGISRFGSGSHIMAYVMGLQNGWTQEEINGINLIELMDINGLVNGIKNNAIDCFLWEVVTTKPYYDAGLAKMLDIVVAPWPAFCLATRKSLSNDTATKFNTVVNSAIHNFVGDFHETGIAQIMKNTKLHYPVAKDIIDWFRKVEYSNDTTMQSTSALRECINALCKAELLNSQQLEQFEALNGDLCKLICHRTMKLQQN